ncbi:hypothetical protein D3C71_1199390 [compost metagenome]
MALIEGGFGNGVIGIGVDLLVFHQIDDELQTGLRTGVGDANVLDVVFAIFILEGITAIGGDNRPGEVGFLQVPHDGAFAFGAQFFVQRRDLFPGFWRLFDQVFVVNQRQRFHGDRVADQLAVVAHSVPGEREQLVLEGFGRMDFRQQAGLRVAAKAVMGPEDDVRAVAGGGNLRVLLFQLVRVFDGHFDAGVFLKLFADLGQAVIAFIAVDPDNQFPFLDLGEGGRGKHQGGQSRKHQCAGGGIAASHNPILLFCGHVSQGERFRGNSGSQSDTFSSSPPLRPMPA